MILFFIFLILFIIISIIFLILIISIIKIKIENMQIGDVAKKDKIKASIELYIFNKIKIFSIKLNSEKFKKMYSNDKFKKININEIKEIVPINKETFNIIKNIKLELEKLDLQIAIGLGEADLSSYFIAIIGSLLGIILPHFVKDKNNKEIKYILQPIYNEVNFNMKLNIVINLKVVYFILALYMLVNKRKERLKKYERTSNRRAYVYSHEFN